MNRTSSKVCNLFPFLCGCFIQFNKMRRKRQEMAGKGKKTSVLSQKGKAIKLKTNDKESNNMNFSSIYIHFYDIFAVPCEKTECSLWKKYD